MLTENKTLNPPVPERPKGAPGACPICGSTKAVSQLRAPDRFHLRTDLFELFRCQSCSLVWLKNPPTPEEMPFHYGAEYHHGITTAGELELIKRWRGPRDRVLGMAKEGGKLLDLGCSSGAFLSTLKGSPWELHGIELSPEEAHRAEQTSGAQVYVGEIMDAPFAPETFDVITCFHVLEHVYDPMQVIQKASEWLKPGGVFYLLIPNIDSWEARIFGSYWYALELPRHLSHFSPTSLRRLFSLADYDESFFYTRPDCYIEGSLLYLGDIVRKKMGRERSPNTADRQYSVPWKIVRKLFRLGVLTPFRRMAAAAGAGAALEAVYRKRVASPSGQGKR